MKYIMFKDRHEALYPVIFPERLIHADVAQYMRGAFSLSHIHAHPFRAGSTTIACLETSGRSETLRLESHPLDRAVINCWDLEHGFPTPLSAKTERLILERSKQIMDEILK